MITFANQDDYISCRYASNLILTSALSLLSKWLNFSISRHHSYNKVEGKIELSEIGPRFEMKGESFQLLWKARLASPLLYITLQINCSHSQHSQKLNKLNTFFQKSVFQVHMKFSITNIYVVIVKSPLQSASFSPHYLARYNKWLCVLTDWNVSCLVYEIRLGTIDQTEADVEWRLKPYMNTAKKRKFLD